VGCNATPVPLAVKLCVLKVALFPPARALFFREVKDIIYLYRPLFSFSLTSLSFYVVPSRADDYQQAPTGSKRGPCRQTLLFALYPARPPAARRNQIKGNLSLAFHFVC